MSEIKGKDTQDLGFQKHELKPKGPAFPSASMIEVPLENVQRRCIGCPPAMLNPTAGTHRHPGRRS